MLSETLKWSLSDAADRPAVLGTLDLAPRQAQKLRASCQAITASHHLCKITADGGRVTALWANDVKPWGGEPRWGVWRRTTGGCSSPHWCLLGLALAVVRVVKRWKRSMDVSDDAQYVEMLAHLSAGSARHHFNPYADVDWKAPEFVVTQNDPRWVLSATDPLGRHPWYLAQPLDKQIAIGMWRQANIAKVTLHLENVLIRGLMHYAFWVPNGSPEYRYCMHEAVEECNHSMMFQEMVNRIGVDVPGMTWWLRWLSPWVSLWAGPSPIVFFFGVLAGEVPVDHMQKSVLREGKALHPIMEKVMAVHVAEESRHISFGHEYIRKRVAQMSWFSRFWVSLYVPIVMRVLCQAVVVPPRVFFKNFDVPRSVRNELFFGSSDSREALREIFGDVRMLCHETALMNRPARLLWRLCKIDGRPSRYRSEPRRAQSTRPAAVHSPRQPVIAPMISATSNAATPATITGSRSPSSTTSA